MCSKFNQNQGNIMIKDMQKIAHCCSYVHYDGMSHYENLHNSLHSTVVSYSTSGKDWHLWDEVKNQGLIIIQKSRFCRCCWRMTEENVYQDENGRIWKKTGGTRRQLVGSIVQAKNVSFPPWRALKSSRNYRQCAGHKLLLLPLIKNIGDCQQLGILHY